MRNSMLMEKIRGASVAVCGLGVSNLPLIDFLLDHGVGSICARDGKERADFGTDAAHALEKKGVRTRFGKTYLEDLSEDVIFRSPGMRPDLPAFAEAAARGALLTSEMELFFELTPATVVGITGSDGKTTTTTLTGLFLEEACRRSGARVYVGGNIGEPLLPRVGEMTENDFAVVELSSFQLQSMKRSPVRAAITNLSPNHLNWHTDMDEYVDAKCNIYRHQPNAHLTVNAENNLARALGQSCGRSCTYFSSSKTTHAEFSALLSVGDRAVYRKESGEIVSWDGEKETVLLDASQIRLPGTHNLENYMTALALTEGLIEKRDADAVADRFTGVKHRLEPIRVLRGVTYYNSSIDSSPTRTAAALSALPKRPIIICGGRNKGLDLAPLAQVLLDRAKAAVLTGEAAKDILKELRAEEEKTGKSIGVTLEPVFADAVLAAHRQATDGDIVLLSPACASFDAFKNFAERGETFRRIVQSLE